MPKSKLLDRLHQSLLGSVYQPTLPDQVIHGWDWLPGNSAWKKFVRKLKTRFLPTGKKWQKMFKAKRSKTPKRSVLVRVPKYLIWICGLVVLTIVGTIVLLLRELPSPTKLTSSENFAVSTQIFDRNGTLLYEIYADENRIPISLDDLPDHVRQATIAIEDKNFYRHFGFDLTGITRALLNNLRGQSVEGGSTITQQLVKNALLSPERSLERKIKEALLSVATELIYSKDDILEMYLNYISYGGTSVGIEAASRRYFDKPANQLTLGEAALLAGLPQAPSRYSPFGSNPEQAKARQALVLDRMAEDGYITPLQAEEAKSEVMQYALSQTDIAAPHFVFYVRDWLYEQYGVDQVEKGGLRVTTTLDLNLQNAVQASVSAEVAKLERYNVTNGAALVIKPDTGEILSMVGSKDYFNEAEDGQVNVTIAHRQPGSSIKPIMYATGFQEKVFNPGTVFLDIPTCFTSPGQPAYCPKNYDGTFKGAVTVRQALGNSLNIPAVKALRTIGLEKFIDQATKMGITTWTDPSQYGLSLTLGGGEVRMIDLAQAFAVLADQGVKVPLTPILKVETYKGEILARVDVDKRRADLNELGNYELDSQIDDLVRVMDRAPAYMASHIMQDNNARIAAFGPKSELVIPNQVVSAKTGTTNNLKDNWTVGFTPEYLTITWVGNNDGAPMNPYLVSGVTGAAPIWNDIMSFILQDREPIWQEKPDSVGSSSVCASGMPPQTTQSCQVQGSPELFWKYSQPASSTVTTKEIWVKADTGLPPAFGEQADNLQLQTKTIYSDPVTRMYCADCTRAVSEDGKVQYEKQTVTHDYQITAEQAGE